MQLIKSLETRTFAGSTALGGLDRQIGGAPKYRHPDNMLCYRGNAGLSPTSNLAQHRIQLAAADGELCYRGVQSRSVAFSVKSDCGKHHQPRERTLCYRGLYYSN